VQAPLLRRPEASVDAAFSTSSMAARIRGASVSFGATSAKFAATWF